MILLFSHSPSVEAFFVRDPSQAMRAADREPAGGEIPVELTSRQPFDDFPQQSGVSRTNRRKTVFFKPPVEDFSAGGFTFPIKIPIWRKSI